MIIIDTDIMVDVLRKYGPAISWLSGVTEEIGIPGIVIIELVEGARSKQEANRILKEVQRYTIHWPSMHDCNRALATFAHLKLSHGVSAFDALIGECAIGLGATLCTCNEKHFKHIVGLKTIQPYAKVNS